MLSIRALQLVLGQLYNTNFRRILLTEGSLMDEIISIVHDDLVYVSTGTRQGVTKHELKKYKLVRP